MRGRPKRKRLISFFPEITYFKPAGIPLCNLDEEILSLDEVEAIRLYDLEGLDQEQAAKKMDISRITFLRIIHEAHKKIGRCLVYGKAIRMRGGDIIMPKRDGTGPMGLGSRTGRRGSRGRGPANQPQGLGGSTECVCPNCGEKIPHTKGVPCTETKCPKCETPMRGIFCQ